MIRFPSQQNYPSATPTVPPSASSTDNSALTSQPNTPAETQNTPSPRYSPEVEKKQREVFKQIGLLALENLRRQRNRPEDKFDGAYVNKSVKKFRAMDDAMRRECHDGLVRIRPNQTASRRLKSGMHITGGAASAVGATVVAGTVALVSAPYFALEGVFMGAALGAVGGYMGTREALKGAPKPVNIIASTGSAILGASLMAVIGPFANIVERGLSRDSPMSKTFHAINKLPRAMERAAFKKLSTREIGQVAYNAMDVNADEIGKKNSDYMAQNVPAFQNITTTTVNIY